MRCAPACEGGDEHDASRIGNAERQLVDLLSGVDDSQSVSQPLHHRARIEETALEAVGGLSLIVGPAESAQQSGITAMNRAAGVHHQKGPRAVGAFGFAWSQAQLSERGGLLVTEQCTDRHSGKGQSRCDRPEVAAAGHQLRQCAPGQTCLFAECIHPLTLCQVHQQCSAGIAHV